MIRKVKRMGDYLNNCRLVEGNTGDKDLFKTIKEARKDKNRSKVNIDGKSGRGVAELFATKYASLFNSCDEEEKVQ